MSSLIEKLVYDTIEEYERLAAENKKLAEALRAEWAALNRPVDQPVDQSVDADGWIEWPGGTCPVDPDVLVEARFQDDDDIYCGAAGDWLWSHDGGDDDIVAYRVVS